MADTISAVERRTSLEEQERLYRKFMVSPKDVSDIVLESPPAYEAPIPTTTPLSTVLEHEPAAGSPPRSRSSSSSRNNSSTEDVIEPSEFSSQDQDALSQQDEKVETLPEYSCDIHIEGVFQRKMEMEDTTKRAEDRQWNDVFLVLHGTALKVYRVKKESRLSGRKQGPNVSPDSPPWLKKGPHIKSYSLSYADVGIAADYRKRRYVIRVRAETEQFLLSCIELTTFISWLDALFAAISVAGPLDERDFPCDHSIPRAQRLCWIRRQQRPYNPATDAAPAPTPAPSRPPPRRRTSTASSPSSPSSSSSSSSSRSRASRLSSSSPHHHSNLAAAHEAVDSDTGKWAPRHKWTQTHDQVYAKLCYGVLLFQSPRKSNFIVAKGRQWFVDWATGKMDRVLPPRYTEIGWAGPWGRNTSAAAERVRT